MVISDYITPVMYTDPSGFFMGWIIIGGAILGGIIGGIAQITANIVLGENLYDGLAGAIAGGAVAGALTALGGMGFVVTGLAAGITTAGANQFQDICMGENWNWGEFTEDFAVTSVLAGFGSYVGQKALGYTARQVANWYVPKSFMTMITGKFIKRVGTAVFTSAALTTDVYLLYHLTKNKIIENQQNQSLLGGVTW